METNYLQNGDEDQDLLLIIQREIGFPCDGANVKVKFWREGILGACVKVLKRNRRVSRFFIPILPIMM